MPFMINKTERSICYSSIGVLLVMFTTTADTDKAKLLSNFTFLLLETKTWGLTWKFFLTF